MNEVFVDTSGWANFFVHTEPYHAKASALMTRWQQQNWCVITTNYVLSELLPLLTGLRVPRERALNLIETIRLGSWVKIIHIDESLDAEAWQYLENRTDKVWSLVDAASFLVMHNRGITNALTTDKHFEQAGFIRLLK